MACASISISNDNHDGLIFAELTYASDVEDSNQYGCAVVDASPVKHILRTGVEVTRREIHDHYLTVGCSVDGALTVNQESTDFRFDYGGVFYFEHGLLLGCGEACCSEGFEYCTWEPEGG